MKHCLKDTVSFEFSKICSMRLRWILFFFVFDYCIFVYLFFFNASQFSDNLREKVTTLRIWVKVYCGQVYLSAHQSECSHASNFTHVRRSDSPGTSPEVFLQKSCFPFFGHLGMACFPQGLRYDRPHWIWRVRKSFSGSVRENARPLSSRVSPRDDFWFQLTSGACWTNAFTLCGTGEVN